jgi:hypothetical protein
MFDLFTKAAPANLITQRNPNAKQVERLLVDNLSKAVEYQSKPEWYLRNEHLLVKLIMAMASPSSNIPTDIYFNGVDLVGSVDQMFGILSDGNQRAKAGQGNFYSDNVKEIYFDYRADIPLGRFKEELFKVPAVKVFKHPYNCIDYKPLDGNIGYGCSELPYCVIGIDIALLYTQYHVWFDSIKDMGTKPSIHNFVFSRVLSKMLDSHVQVALTNRFLTHYRGEKDNLAFTTTKLPYFVHDVHTEIDKVYAQLVHELSRTAYDFSSILGSVPVMENTALEALRLPIRARVPQTRWINYISRMNVIDSLFGHCPDATLPKSSDILLEWKNLSRNILADMNLSYPWTPSLEPEVKRIATRLFNQTR